MSRERESFPERLKRWLLSGGASASPSNAIVLTEELKAELSGSSPLPKRLNAIAELSELLTTSKLEKVRKKVLGRGSGRGISVIQVVYSLRNYLPVNRIQSERSSKIMKSTVASRTLRRVSTARRMASRKCGAW